MHVRWRREAALGRSRRRSRVAPGSDGDAGKHAATGYGTWESAELAERFAAAFIFGPPASRAGSLPPSLVLLSGLPGSGKSHLARELAAQAPVTVISSDRVRRLLIAKPTYSEEEHEFIHTTCYRLAQRGLTARRAVIFDATNLQHEHRRRFRELAHRQRASWHLVLVDCEETTARARLQQRARGEALDGSDADERVYDLLRQLVEPVREPHLRLRGDGDVRAAARTLLALLRPEVVRMPSHAAAAWAAVAGAGH